jgi:hypothetical protein
MMNPNAKHRRLATAMSEMVLVLPLLFVVLSLLIYLGRGVVRVQRALVMDRYETWRLAEHAPGPGIDNAVDSPQLNQLFFGEHAENIYGRVRGGFSDEALEQMIAIAYGHSTLAGTLAQTHTDQADTGLTVRFTINHTTGNRLWQRFDGPIRHDHTRIGHDWAYLNGWRANPWVRIGPYGQGVLGPVRDIFLQDFDRDLEQIDRQDNDLARRIRNLYLQEPEYRGPTVQ